jgi:hypothetical protein
VDTARKMISSMTVPLLDFARSLIKREMAYINVESDEFASSSLVLGAFDRQRPSEVSSDPSMVRLLATLAQDIIVRGPPTLSWERL